MNYGERLGVFISKTNRSVLLKGRILDAFPIRSNIRQRCLLSLSTIILLALANGHKKELNGKRIIRGEIKLLFANNMLNCIENPIESITNC